MNSGISQEFIERLVSLHSQAVAHEGVVKRDNEFYHSRDLISWSSWVLERLN